MYANMSRYCKEQGMTLDEYENYKVRIDNMADIIFSNKVVTAPPGLFFPVDELLADIADEQQRLFVVQRLKRLGVEFRDNTTLWRY